VPYSYNYMLNPEHQSFSEIEVHDAEELPIDPRLATATQE